MESNSPPLNPGQLVLGLTSEKLQEFGFRHFPVVHTETYQQASQNICSWNPAAEIPQELCGRASGWQRQLSTVRWDPRMDPTSLQLRESPGVAHSAGRIAERAVNHCSKPLHFGAVPYTAVGPQTGQIMVLWLLFLPRKDPLPLK